MSMKHTHSCMQPISFMQLSILESHCLTEQHAGRSLNVPQASSALDMPLQLFISTACLMRTCRQLARYSLLITVWMASCITKRELCSCSPCQEARFCWKSATAATPLSHMAPLTLAFLSRGPWIARNACKSRHTHVTGSLVLQKSRFELSNSAIIITALSCCLSRNKTAAEQKGMQAVICIAGAQVTPLSPSSDIKAELI